jgi:hypothetical protein
MLGLAALNRYWAAPSLRDSLNHQSPTRQSLHALRTTLVAETGLALLVLISVSILYARTASIRSMMSLA